MVSNFFTPDVMAGLQELFTGFYQTEIQIYSRTSTDNEFSDDEEKLSRDPVVVMGWMRNQPDTKLMDTGGAVQKPQTGRLFIPVDVIVELGDKLTIEGEDWRVIDHNRENTFKVTQRVAIERV